MLKIIRLHIPLFGLLLATLLVVVSGGVVKGQTKNFLTGQKTADYLPAGSLFNLGNGDADISAPMIKYNHNGYRFFYGDVDILNSDLVTSSPVTIKAARTLGLFGLLGTGADVYIQFRASGNIDLPANTTTYFTLGAQKPELSGVGIPLLGLLGLAELQNIKGLGYSGAKNYSLSGNGDQENGIPLNVNTVNKLIVDKNGVWYAAVTPSVAYNSIRLNVSFPTDIDVLNVDRTLTANVYNAFTITPGGACTTRAQFTNAGNATGIHINTGAVIKQLGLSQLIANPHWAIEGDPTKYSTFSSGLASIGVASTISQTFYFDHPATVNDGLHFHLGLNNSLINLQLLALNGIKFYAYLGTSEDPVATAFGLGDIANLLGINLLGLIDIGTSHKDIDFTFKPGVKFDRIRLEYDQGLVGINVLSDVLRVYDVALAPPTPIITTQPTSNINSTNICEGSSASFTIASNTAVVPITNYDWQYYNGSTWISTGAASSPTYTISETTNEMNNRRYRVILTAGNSGCAQIIISNEAILTVKPRATASDIFSDNQSICDGQSATLTASSSTITNPIFRWYSNDTLTGTVLSTDASYTVNPTTTTNYYVTVQGTSHCENAPSSVKKVTVTVHPKPPTPHLNFTTNTNIN